MNPCDSDSPCNLVGFFLPSTTASTTSFHYLNTCCVICLCLLLGLLSLQSCPFYWTSCVFLTFLCHSRLCHLYCIFFQLPLFSPFSFWCLLYLKKFCMFASRKKVIWFHQWPIYSIVANIAVKDAGHLKYLVLWKTQLRSNLPGKIFARSSLK